LKKYGASRGGEKEKNLYILERGKEIYLFSGDELEKFSGRTF